MKKNMIFVLLSFIIILSSICGGVVVFAQEMVKSINFDQNTKTLSITTNPDADIFLSNLAGRYSADSEGNFSITVSGDLDRETILINDYLTNESTEFDFDFKKNTIASDEVSTDTTTTSTSSSSSSSSKVANSKATSTTEKEKNNEVNSSTSDASVTKTSSSQTNPEKKENNSFYFWGLIGIVIILIAGVVFFMTGKSKKNKHGKHSGK